MHVNLLNGAREHFFFSDDIRMKRRRLRKPNTGCASGSLPLGA